MISRLLIPLAAAVALLVGCGGSDSADKANPTPTPTPAPLTLKAVNELPLDTPRTEVERRFGPPAKPDFVPREIKRGEPQGFNCVYYVLRGKGGAKRNYAQLCFGPRDTLDSKLTLVNADGSGAAAVAGGV